MELREKVAIVTGAGGGGQGRALALRLGAEGAHVVISDLDEAGGSETLDRLEAAGGSCAFLRADAGSEADIAALVGFAEERFGGLDILVNSAGPYFPGDRLAGWDKTLRANLLGPVEATLQAIEPMRRRGGGAILYYGSVSALGYGHRHSPSPSYDVAKCAVARLATTMSWLRESYNIRTNCIVPDWVGTDEIVAYVRELSPAERVARKVPDQIIPLEEITSAALRLIADDSLSGRVLVWWCGAGPALIAEGDPGYARLEPLVVAT